MHLNNFMYPHDHHEHQQPILDVQHISVRYNGQFALEDITFHLHEGERVAVVGPNGAGKSTLFKVISGVLPPTSGEANIFGSRPRGHVCIAYVPQRSQVDWNFPVSVADVVMMGRSAKLGPLNWPHKKDWEHVNRALEIVELSNLADRQISQLSGGQQQRMFIARALAQEAELMLMDEPLTGLDTPSQEGLLNLLDTLRNQKVTVMVATHDLDQAARHFDRILLLNHRIVAFGNPNEVLQTENLLSAVGIVCAVVGTYVVLRGMAFFGDALAHTILPGIALGYLVNGGARDPLFWWALGTAIVAALGIGVISKNAEIKEDTAIGIIFAGMFALGIALISTVRSYAVDLSHFLFGDVLSVSVQSLWLILLFGGLVLIVIFAFYKEFLTLSFDPILATTLRLPVGVLNNLLLVLIAITVAVSLQTVGVALMVAMLVTPAASAYLLTHRLSTMMLLASVFASLSGIIGLYLSYYLSIASGAAIVLTATFFFILAFAWKKLRSA